MDGEAREIMARLVKEPAQLRFCFHPEAPTGCSGEIVKAHTIPRAASLSKIAVRGHVGAYNPRDVFAAERGGFELKREGVGDASTILGFCSNHDAPFFAPLELKDFEGTPEQVFLLHYRAFSRELFTKKGQEHLFRRQRENFEGLTKALPAEKKEEVKRLVDRNVDELIPASLRDLESARARLVDMWKRRAFSELCADFYYFDELPPFMCSGATCPTFDVVGERLQDLQLLDVRAELASISVLAAFATGAMVIAFDERDARASTFAASVRAAADLEHVLANVVFFSLDNVAVHLDWWAKIPEHEKIAFRDRFNDMLNPYGDFVPGQLARFIPSLVAPRVTANPQLRRSVE